MTISLMSHGMVSYLYQQKPEASQALRLVSATHQWKNNGNMTATFH
jgi:hypothetical protein